MTLCAKRLFQSVSSLALAIGITAAPAFAACDLQALNLFPSKYQNGANVPYTPKIGEPYRVTLDYRIVGTPAAPFKIRFTMAGIEKHFNMPAQSAGDHSVSCQFDLPLDGVIPVQAYLDPDHVTGEPSGGLLPYLNNFKISSFSPAPPAKAIDTYAPRKLKGSQSIQVKFVDGPLFDLLKINRFTIMFGKPDTDAWQKVTQSSFAATNGVWNETLQPVVANAGFGKAYMWDHTNVPLKTIYATQHYEVEQSNTRVDLEKLRDVTWAQLDALAPVNVFKFFQSPDAVTESDSPTIHQFVVNTLGANWRQSYTPYDAARALFQAVLKRVEYVYPSPSHTAVAVYNNKEGDCGAYSLLIVAALRHIGFPARTSCGIWEGGAGHCWAEAFFPWAGWMVMDGSAGDGLSPDGKYAFYFGNIPNMNARIAFMRGNEFTVNGITHNWLQGPQIWTTAWGLVADVKVTATLEVDN